MHKSYLSGKLFFVLFTMILLCSCGKRESDSSETSNLFQYALEIEDGVFSLRQVDFYMSMEEVLQIIGSGEYTLIEMEGSNRIKTNVNIPGFPDDIIMEYVFDNALDNRLIGIDYHIYSR